MKRNFIEDSINYLKFAGKNKDFSVPVESLKNFEIEIPKPGNDIPKQIENILEKEYKSKIEDSNIVRDAGSISLLREDWMDSDKMTALDEKINNCSKCPLHKTRTNFVFGTGSHESDVMLIGEAPGAEEDIQGKPFVGRAGKLLTDILKAINFTRDEVFICNVIKCRPPGNRDPEADEVAACEGYLLRQLDIIKPKLIVALGRVAVQCLLGSKVSITRIRGEWREYHGIPLMPTFHPAYLLRSPGEKRKCWEDLQKVMAEYERLVGPLPR